MLIDLHVLLEKSEYDKQTILSVMQKAKETGLDGLAFVLREDFSKINEICSVAGDLNLKLFFGVEIKTTIGSFVFFPSQFNETIKKMNWNDLIKDRDETNLQNIFHELHLLGGIIVAYHPYNRDIGLCFGDKVYHLKDVDAVEIVNQNSSMTQNDLALEASNNLNIPAVGGSGNIKDIKDIGRTATLFLNSVSDQSELVEAIAKGEVWAAEFLSLEDLSQIEFDDHRMDSRKRTSYGRREYSRDERGRNYHSRRDNNRQKRSKYR